MFIHARVDYGMRALLVLAEMGPAPVTSEALASAQHLPAKFLSSILNDMRRAGIVVSQRGTEGGYRLARPAEDITLADVMLALDGSLTEVGGRLPDTTRYFGAARHLGRVWVSIQAGVDELLEQVSLDDVVHGRCTASGAMGPMPS